MTESRWLVAGRGVVAGLVLAVASCSPASDPQPTNPDFATGAQDQAEALIEVPHPNLDGAEPEIREQIEDGRKILDQQLTAQPRRPEALAAAFGTQGVVYLAYNFRDAAAACFTNAEALNRDDHRWPYYRGHLAQLAGDLEAAARAYRRAVELDPNSLPATLALAEVELEAGNLDRADSLLTTALDQSPGHLATLAAQGRLAQAQGDPNQAIALFQRVLARAPEASTLHYPLGLSYRAVGDLDRAQYFLARRGTGEVPLDNPLLEALDGEIQGSQVHVRRGNEAFLAGRAEEAVREFRLALDRLPDDVDARVNLAVALAATEAVDEALSQLETALEAEPDHVKGNFSLGTLLARRGQRDAAIELYRTALAADPDHRDSQVNLANALFRSNRFAEAEPWFARVVEADSANAVAHYGLALSQMRLERWQEAADSIDSGLQALPDHPALTNLKVRLLAASPVDALRNGSRAMQLGKRLIDSASTLENIEAYAMALAEVGRFDEAIQYQRAALEAAQKAGRRDLAAELEGTLRRYQRRQPSRSP